MRAAGSFTATVLRCTRRWPTLVQRASARGRSFVCLAGKEREARLQWVSPENRQEVARVLEIAERAAERWETTFTDFLSPPVVADALGALAGMADVTAIPWGGYPQVGAGQQPQAMHDAWAQHPQLMEPLRPQAERCRIALGREEVLSALQDDPSQLGGVAALQVRGNFMFDPATHRDFLGAILNTGERGQSGGRGPAGGGGHGAQRAATT